MLFKASGKDYVSLSEVCSIFDASTRNTESNTVDINSLNNEAINKVWTELLLFLNSCSGSVGRFVVHNIDTLCSMSDGSCEFLVSLLLAGVASILRYYSHIGDREALLNSVSVEFTVLNTELGSRVADSLQFFVEKSLRLTVSRSREDNFKAAYDELISSIPCIEFSDDDWMDAICGEIVDAHEMLCDKDTDAAGSGSFISPIVLLIAPPEPSLRVALEKQILDSYSSEALRVQSDGEWSHAQFDKNAPLVFICSSYWLVEQMSMPRGDGLLHRLNVQIIVHGGFCEIGDSAEEEILRCVIALKSCGIQWEEMRVMQHREPSYWRLEEPVTFRSNSALAQECANVLLLLFRRFLTPYSPFSKQPYTSLPRDIFCSRRGWDFYHRLTQTLRLAGVLAPEAAAPFETIELTVLGRFLSAKKRELCYKTRDAFHKCLDTLPEDPEKECAAQKKLFEQSCPKSWVSYFEKQREREVILQLQVEHKLPKVHYLYTRLTIELSALVYVLRQ
ncbi:Cytochrome oxidase c subunit VIb family protein [Leishmania donovani]|uniref:Cytochrome oxidase c subunit VIb family protein n=1 Tax=Leishmania donovani TaxID=5661 RepID=A0A504X4G8_LEIDO|nr:Cytochrome oxidase c subunit VIb family protein [Leishmania donovani]